MTSTAEGSALAQSFREAGAECLAALERAGATVGQAADVSRVVGEEAGRTLRRRDHVSTLYVPGNATAYGIVAVHVHEPLAGTLGGGLVLTVPTLRDRPTLVWSVGATVDLDAWLGSGLGLADAGHLALITNELLAGFHLPRGA